MKNNQLIRCPWCEKDDLYRRYHDEEWGVPLHYDNQLFELLCLEGFQAGLSWHTVLKKREHYREVCDHWDPAKIAAYTQKKIATLLDDPGVIRNRLKLAAMVSNAQAFLAVQQEHGTFSEFIWHYVDDTPIVNHWETLSEVPARTDLSDRISRDLQKLGFKFVGSTICYAFMQAAGLVDDHLLSCWKRKG
ncbi:DNA-3-methyladenine glycosylase I [Chrysiogenes arsenatis]|uniref:DNA-3-methyladenine glycosylase I n=1 Tax=Chrysiogenes arsenatis TaxID=309797 RepID=UPI00041D5DAF|nr:DNA-3-methyladenine glycosylase I [Chrysiogenes arsenatis]